MDHNSKSVAGLITAFVRQNFLFGLHIFIAVVGVVSIYWFSSVDVGIFVDLIFWVGIPIFVLGSIFIIRNPYFFFSGRGGFANVPRKPLNSVLLSILMLVVLAMYSTMIVLFVDGVAMFANGWIGKQEVLVIPCGITRINVTDSADDLSVGQVECRDDIGKNWRLEVWRRKEIIHLKEKLKPGDRIKIRVLRGALGLYYASGVSIFLPRATP